MCIQMHRACVLHACLTGTGHGAPTHFMHAMFLPLPPMHMPRPTPPQEMVNMDFTRQDFGCTGDCTWVLEEFIEAPTWSCNSPNVSSTGSFIGHIWPGGSRG